MYTIYVLIDPFTELPRYVGRTKDPTDFRFSRHWHSRKRHHCCREWLTQLGAAGVKPEIQILSIGEAEKRAENQWIALYESQGLELLNIYQKPVFFKKRRKQKRRYNPKNREQNRKNQAAWKARHLEHRVAWQRQNYLKRKSMPGFREKNAEYARNWYRKNKSKKAKTERSQIGFVDCLWEKFLNLKFW